MGHGKASHTCRLSHSPPLNASVNPEPLLGPRVCSDLGSTLWGVGGVIQVHVSLLRFTFHYSVHVSLLGSHFTTPVHISQLGHSAPPPPRSPLTEKRTMGLSRKIPTWLRTGPSSATHHLRDSRSPVHPISEAGNKPLTLTGLSRGW